MHAGQPGCDPLCMMHTACHVCRAWCYLRPEAFTTGTRPCSPFLSTRPEGPDERAHHKLPERLERGQHRAQLAVVGTLRVRCTPAGVA